MRTATTFALLLAWVLVPAARGADEVVVRLVSGETLRGTLVSEDAGGLRLRHALLGEVVIPGSAVAAVERIQAGPEEAPSPPASPAPAASTGPTASTAESPASPAPPAAPAPQGGDVELHGPPEPVPAGVEEVGPPAPGRPNPGPVQRPSWAKEEIDLLQRDDRAAPPPGEERWWGWLQLAASGVSSGTDQFDMNVSGALVRRTHDDKLSAAVEYYLRLIDNSTSDDNLLGTLEYDRYFDPSPWLAFGKLQYQYDRFEAWEHRISAYAGPGYRFVDAPDFRFTGKLGAGGTYEIGTPESVVPEGYGELAFRWRLDRRQRLEGSVWIAPDLTDLGEYRVLARLNWVMQFDPGDGLALVAGLREEYDSSVPPGDVQSDFRYYAGVRFDF